MIDPLLNSFAPASYNGLTRELLKQRGAIQMRHNAWHSVHYYRIIGLLRDVKRKCLQHITLLHKINHVLTG
jgi:hypothetical protein